MPHLDGDELLKILRKDHRYAETPVIFATGNANDVHRSKVSRTSNLYLLEKPFSKSEMLKLIEFIPMISILTG